MAGTKGKKTFTQSYGSNDLDAWRLLMEQYNLLAMDPKYISTVKAIERELSLKDFFSDIKILMILVSQVLHSQSVLFGFL